MVINAYKYIWKSRFCGDFWTSEKCIITTAELLGITPEAVMKVLRRHKASRIHFEPDGRKTKFIRRLQEFSTFDSLKRIAEHLVWKQYESKPPNHVRFFR